MANLQPRRPRCRGVPRRSQIAHSKSNRCVSDPPLPREKRILTDFRGSLPPRCRCRRLVRRRPSLDRISQSRCGNDLHLNVAPSPRARSKLRSWRERSASAAARSASPPDPLCKVSLRTGVQVNRRRPHSAHRRPSPWSASAATTLARHQPEPSRSTRPSGATQREPNEPDHHAVDGGLALVPVKAPR